MESCFQFNLGIKKFFVRELFCWGWSLRDSLVQHQLWLAALEVHQWRRLCQKVAQRLAFRCAWHLSPWLKKVLPLCLLLVIVGLIVHLLIIFPNKWTLWLPG